MRFKIGILSILVGGSAFGQVTTSDITIGNTIIDRGSSSYFIGGGAATWSSVGCPGCGISSNLSLVGLTIETRKDDGRGPTLVQVKSSAHKIPALEIATPTWLKLAKQINLDSAAVDEANLAKTISEHEWSVYDYAKVDDYLYRQALRMGTNTRWVWKPVREADMKLTSGANTWSVRPAMGFVYPKVYGRAIPERIMDKIACVLQDMPDALFLVSDFEVVKPDPFLAVTTAKLLGEDKIYIVAQWNEPGFTEAPPKHQEPVVAPGAPRVDGKQIAAVVH
jgi:hypothetical protein